MIAPPERMTEDELLAAAREAFLRAISHPPGSLERAIQWTVYDRYAGELRVRASEALLRAMRRGGPR